MPHNNEIERIKSGVQNLDALLNGGLPCGAVTIVCGPPGSGKTTLVQQICFEAASATRRVLYFSTLSEPSAKLLRYLAPFSFFDAKKLEEAIEFVDLGSVLAARGAQAAAELIFEHLQRVKPAFVVIDSFKVFDDMAESQVHRRLFSYELAVNLMTSEATAFLLGEYGQADILSNPIFSIVDGQILLDQRSVYDEQRRMIRVAKMRGTNHNRDEHQFVIGDEGLHIYAPRVTIVRQDRGVQQGRLAPGISRLDDLMGAGIPRGSSLLISGVAGTGKTALLLNFVYAGALKGEKGIIFSFEETAERLLAAARGFGWNLEREIKRGMIELVFIPQPDINVESHIIMMQDRIGNLGARRVAIDSISVFLHKVRDPQIAREKVFQIATIIQNVQAVGFLATDIAYGTSLISRFGVEETVVDGVVVLTSTEEGLERHRYLEVYKLRNTAHLKGRHSLVIDEHGIEIFPRYSVDTTPRHPLPPLTKRRLSTGIPDLDRLLHGGLLQRSVTLVSGSAGAGKSTFGLQFLAAGLAVGEPGLFVTLEEGPKQVLAAARSLGLPFQKAVKEGLADVLFMTPENVRSSQYFSILAAKIKELSIQRLVLDGVAHMAKEDLGQDELRELLIVLVAQFKQLGVTTMLTLEATSMFSAEVITDRSFSAVSDNLIALRYEVAPGELKPYIVVVKTRGSKHDRGTYYFSVDDDGMKLGAPVDLTRFARASGPLE
ncbi:MAG: repair protein RadA [Cyanobacteria bacterium RYN_339]|nr:repair protein RadA [Cyanobacteria bacterium RYN_339]